MASENLAKLQATVNRFAGEVGFSPLAVDGGMGTKTADAVVAAVGWASDADRSCEDSTTSGGTLCIDAGQAATARALLNAIVTSGGASDQQRIMDTNVGLNTFLSQVADKAGFGRAAIVTIAHSSSGFTPDKSAFTVKPPPGAGWAASTQLWFRQLPTWGQVGVGVGGGVALLFVMTKFRGKSSSKLAGYRRKSR